MRVWSLILLVVCFVISGEVLIRITDHFKILESTRLQKIEIAIETSPELALYQGGQIDYSDSSLRILVIGYSYIHGGGIQPEDKISNKLKELLKQYNHKYKNTYVLDVSRPDANNLDNTRAYFNYEDFKPQIVILGYHFNDINGNLEDDKGFDTANFRGHMNTVVQSGSQSKMFIRQVTDFLYNSAILEYLMPKFNNIMLSNGYIIPKSRLANTLKYYETNHRTWQKSKTFLSKMINDMKGNGSQLLVYHFAYTNLIEYPELFENSSILIEQFFESFDNVSYVSGIEQFKGERASDYFIYKHDGHPNAKAHELIAKKIYETIEQKIKEGFVKK